MKKTIIATSLGFLLGVYAHANMGDIRSYFNYEVEKGFYENPYGLELIVERNEAEKIEVYLQDKESDKRYKVGPGPHLGGFKHRIKGANPLREVDREWFFLVLDILL